MSKPLIVVSTFRVKEGKAAELKSYYQSIADIVAANEPQIIAFYGFLNEAATEMTSIQVHPDTASMDFHMQVLRDNWDESFSRYSELVEAISVDYYGTPPPSALDMDLQREYRLGLKPRHLAGFVRTARI
jgi:hypothetical protein